MFGTPLSESDPQMEALINRDVERQRTHVQLIASENFVSRAVMQASGSVLTNKYSEGYPGKRYYEGCEIVDEIESLAIERAKALFGAEHANVQAHSGAQANMGVYYGLLKPGDKILGMRLDQGGHLTHGSPVNFSGILYDFVSYGVDPETEVVDMDQVAEIARAEHPKMIVAGYSAYSRILDWARFREIADEVGALLMVDAAHIIGLIAGRAHPDPIPHAHVVTATTHKALRGPRGGMILSTAEHAAAIDKGVFPNAQGGPLNNHIAAKAVCYAEASTHQYRAYAAQIVANAAAMAAAVAGEGVRVVSGGTDNHLFLVDLRSVDDDLTGKDAARLLSSVGITLNFNTIPFDPRPPYRASGLRIGTPAATTCGMKESEVAEVGRLLAGALRGRSDARVLEHARQRIGELAEAFPAYPPDFPGHV
ncbi:MAG: serine hydroxymethyltransferase [Actinobacteria bacterium RBG_16_68_21]|nr:MAG: serine hydroxymethyltransferase [Actinobacteria bacterium RBG_16_68_21]